MPQPSQLPADLKTLEFDMDPCPADGKERQLSGYAFADVGVDYWFVTNITIIPDRAIPTTVELRTASNPPFKTIAVFKRLDGQSYDRAFTEPESLKWERLETWAVYCTATGGGEQRVRVRVDYFPSTGYTPGS